MENRGDVRDAVVERLRFLGEFRVEVVPTREDVVIARAVRERSLAEIMGDRGRRPRCHLAPA
jgi:hypothetical protein